MPTRNAHCSYCGQAFAPQQPWPRTCAHCAEISYLNPIPVAVLLLPVDGGLLVVRRTLAVGRGKLALPGGFINYGESWQEGACRELFEETGVTADSALVKHFRTASAPDSTVLIFGVAAAMRAADLPPFTANSEIGERLVIQSPTPMAFSLHTQAANDYFAGVK